MKWKHLWTWQMFEQHGLHLATGQQHSRSGRSDKHRQPVPALHFAPADTQQSFRSTVPDPSSRRHEAVFLQDHGPGVDRFQWTEPRGTAPVAAGISERRKTADQQSSWPHAAQHGLLHGMFTAGHVRRSLHRSFRPNGNIFHSADPDPSVVEHGTRQRRSQSARQLSVADHVLRNANGRTGQRA